ncbi:MAG: hypothetical protein IJU02_03255, partial [Lachnospiraceae bacterium]|nr:hypothetical protein [Lachnospiraceae bacterium]
MSNTFWGKLSRNDKQKLIYTYIALPLITMAQLGGEFTSNMYQQTRQVITPPCGAIFTLVMTSYLPLILPPIAIRFGYFKRPLSYGLELFVSMWVSTFVHFILVFILTGVSVGTQGLLGIIAVYCVLSYKTSGYNEIPKQQR